MFNLTTKKSLFTQNSNTSSESLSLILVVKFPISSNFLDTKRNDVMSENRRLAAIMFTDIVGYTAMMQQNEQQTLSSIKKHRQVLEECTSNHGGRVIQYYGDGSLSIYPSCVNAIYCAMKIQDLLRVTPVVPLRIGIHIGEILEMDGDIYGSAINLAARIQAEGVASSILISNAVHEEIRNQTEFQTINLGDFDLKNVEDSQGIHAIINNDLPVPDTKSKLKKEKSAPVSNTPNNLPKLLTTFFGREYELEQIKSFIQSNRLCTITGSGGIGKTRLSIELGQRLLNQFPQGVYFIDLVPVLPGSSDSIADSCLEVLQVQGKPSGSSNQLLAEHINDKRILLVLDNSEHLIEECAHFVWYQLTKTSSLQFVVTSRVRLNIEGEQVWPLATLSFPSIMAGSKSEETQDFESIQLFLDRARLVMPGFRPGEKDWQPISQICNHLDGIPLAIELAAARIRTFSPEILLERLRESSNLLKSRERTRSPRQRTIKNLIDWSFQLLSPQEQELFLNLSVFADSFDIVGAEEVCTSSAIKKEEVIDLIDLLLDKSLIVPISGNRYRLLELVKQFGRNKLREANRWKSLVDNFYHYLLKIVENAYRNQLKASEESLNKLRQEQENILNVLEWVSGQSDKQFELVSYLGWYWNILYHKYRIGAVYLKEGIQKHQKPDLTRGRALVGFGRLTHYQHDLKAEKWLKESISILQELPPSFELATAYLYLGEFYASYDNHKDGEETFLKGIRIAEQLGDSNFLVRANSWVCYAYIAQQLPDKAAPIIERNLPLALRENMKWDQLMNRHFYADCALIKEDFETALERYRNAFNSALEVGDHFQVPYEIQGMAMSFAGLDNAESALFLKGVATQYFINLDLKPHPANWWDRLLEKHLGGARDILGEEVAAREEARGKDAPFKIIMELIREGATTF